MPAVATKQLFADELQRLAKEKPVSKINVAEICRGCDATRQTFYYHFHDKYDLVAWIYLQDLSHATGPKDDMGEESLTRMLDAIWDKRDFYLSALQDTSQNNLMNYMRENSTEFIMKSLKGRYHLTSTRQLRMEVRYHSYGAIGLIVEWLNGTCQTSSKELAGLLSRNIELLARDHKE